MTAEAAVTLRAQAAHARELAENMLNRAAADELRRIAAKLEAEADEIGSRQATSRIPPPTTGA